MQHGAGVFRLLIQQFDCLWCGDDHKLDVPPPGLVSNLLCDRQRPLGSSSYHETLAVPRKVLRQCQWSVAEPVAQLFGRLLLAASAASPVCGSPDKHVSLC